MSTWKFWRHLSLQMSVVFIYRWYYFKVMKSKAINKMIIMIKLKIKKSFFLIYIKNLLSIKNGGRHSTTDVPSGIITNVRYYLQEKKLRKLILSFNFSMGNKLMSFAPKLIILDKLIIQKYHYIFNKKRKIIKIFSFYHKIRLISFYNTSGRMMIWMNFLIMRWI